MPLRAQARVLQHEDFPVAVHAIKAREIATLRSCVKFGAFSAMQ